MDIVWVSIYTYEISAINPAPTKNVSWFRGVSFYFIDIKRVYSAVIIYLLSQNVIILVDNIRAA